MKRIRISTVMLCIVIIALCFALVVERKRSQRLLAEVQVREMVARDQAVLAQLQARLAQDAVRHYQEVQNSAATKKADGGTAKPEK